MILRHFSLLFFSLLLAVQLAAAPKPNVLFIAIDDLRPQLGAYGDQIVKSPNIDKLASRSVVFNRAYCQYPLCNPSRASLLTGLRPETLNILDLKTNIRDIDRKVVTLPELFKTNGYQSFSIGKIFHTTNGNRPDPQSWTETLSISPQGAGAPGEEPDTDADAKSTASAAKGKKKAGGTKGKAAANVDPNASKLPYEAPDVADEELSDGRVAATAIQALRDHKDKPFFIGAGFHKPHMPFVAPKKYWDLYDPAQIQLAPNGFHPKDSPEFASNKASELRRYSGVSKTEPIPEEEQRKLIHGYIACVSYTDAQIGKVLDELDRQGLTTNTIVVLWGDHGYHLGEHDTWNKRTNWEVAARVPMMISAPATSVTAAKTNALVELVDLYPTLTELAGLEAPYQLEGTSLLPLMNNPSAPWKTAAFHVNESSTDPAEKQLGRAIRTERYRLIEWTGAKSGKKAYELYDHKSDPQENENVAAKPEHAQTLEHLKSQLTAGWQGAKPAR